MATATLTGQVRRDCAKCHGEGRIGMYAHVAAGVCFACNGEGSYLTPADWRQREARATARRKAADAKRAANGANARLWDAFAAAHPTEAALIEANERAEQPDATLGYAYSAVATHDERDSNPAQALDLVRTYLTRNR